MAGILAAPSGCHAYTSLEWPVGRPAVGHDLGQCDALAWVLAQHARDEVFQTRRYCWLVGERDGLSTDDVVQPHDAGVLEWHCACK